MWVPRGNAPQCECEAHAVQWIQKWFSDCVYTPWDMFGFAIGLSSILFWLVAQLPQFVRNIRCQSAEALSPWFLFQWLSGDTLNLLGCILTGNQLATETFTACYFIFADSCIITQYVYYQIRNKEKSQREADAFDSDTSVRNPSSGYYWAISHSESGRPGFDSRSKLIPSGAAESGKKKPQRIKGQNHQPYQPVTFVTGRSGAVMIAHAWQGPHKPLTPSENVTQSRRDGQNAGNKPTGHAGNVGSRTVPGKPPHYPRDLPNPSSKVVRQKGEITVASTAQQRPERLGNPVTDSVSSVQKEVVAGPSRSKATEQSRKHRQRSLRRVVEEYGLEYGPPLHSRLTIHHNWQGNGQRIQHVPLPLKTSGNEAGNLLAPAGEKVNKRVGKESGTERRVHGHVLIGKSLGLLESCSEASKSAQVSSEDVKVVASSDTTTNSSGDKKENEVGLPFDREPASDSTMSEKTERQVGGGDAGGLEADRHKPCETGSDPSQCVGPTAENSNHEEPVNSSTTEGVPLQRKCALACIAGLIFCSSLLQTGGGFSIGRYYDQTTDLGNSGVLFDSEKTFLQRPVRRLLADEPLELWHGRLAGPWARAKWRYQAWIDLLRKKEHRFLKLFGEQIETTEEGLLGVQGPGRRLLVMCGVTVQPEWLQYLGLLLGWGSAGFYLGSRISQIVCNSQRNSAEGLSLAMFFCAFLANLTYGLAILLRADNWAELSGKAPWLVGSMGTLSLDITIFLQAQYLERSRLASLKEASEKLPLLRQVV